MRLKTALIAHPLLSAVILLTLVGVAAGAVPAFNASEKAGFCLTCHEMRPYHDAWSTGPHKSVECVSCHVDSGTVNHVKHKVQASKELWTHLTGNPTFPKGTAEVPDQRCLACHAGIPGKTGPGFSHKAHVRQSRCIECHANTGHRVSLAALKRENVLSASAAASSSPAAARATTSTAVHPTVGCMKCHALTKTACSKCHESAHPARGECTTCHLPGPRWVFTHPSSTDCATCHKAPAKHFGPACSTCHSVDVPFAKTRYTHNGGACSSCHEPPAGHYAVVSCETCHRTPGSWAHSHPSSSSCASCHSAPAKHNRAVACASCHRTPGSWAHSHPSSNSCASCHSAPGGHYGSSCASCHRPGVAWRNATFSHPRVQHGYRAFACAKCHPSGYRSHSCTTCHGAGGPEEGDGGGDDD